MSNESIKSRKYYRVHNGESWDRMHFVTDANSVDANDGDNMETKVGAIKGITTSTEVTEEGYAADATTVAALNSSLGGFEFYTDEQGKAYYKPMGADAGIPFNNFKRYYNSTDITITKASKNYEIGFKPKFFMIGDWGQGVLFWYDETFNKHFYGGYANNGADIGSWGNYNLFKLTAITDTGFIAECYTDFTQAFIFAFG